MLSYWLYERAEIFEPRKGMEEKKTQGSNMGPPHSKALLEINLTDIEEDKVSEEPQYTHYI